MTRPASPRIVAAEDAATTAPADGRRKRGERSRRQIVEAIRALIGAGEMNPSAAQVAERAGVSLRSVFRHFEDMDSLYREIAALVEAEVMPLALRPFEAREWRGRLVELTARRADIFERIMPFRVAGAARRFQSAYLMDDYCRTISLEQTALKAILPPEIADDALLFAALDVIVGFESWRRMRQDQGLSMKKAEAAMRFAVERLTAGL
ncbi:MAG: TetR family transcriptional regulator [Alphaproteobacteria bacterium]|nr:TetR family transcriptional regulator [Alphaproteobacteria bacterium]